MYEYLGTWAIAADQGPGSKQLHSVYASPGAVTAFRTNGHFPDGAVLVKEVYETATSPMTTGTVSHAETLAGWFVMVKDSKNSHPQNKLSGSGWAWSWFDAVNPLKTTSTDYTTDCQPCHIPAQSTDWIYTQGYPVLHKDLPYRTMCAVRGTAMSAWSRQSALTRPVIAFELRLRWKPSPYETRALALRRPVCPCDPARRGTACVRLPG